MGAKQRLCIVLVVLQLASVYAARADSSSLDSVVCTIDVTLSTVTANKLQLFALTSNTSPSYTMTVTGSCLYPVLGVPQSRSTTITATPTTTDDVVTCDVMRATGTWSQTFSGLTPTDVSGRYELTGTWGAWVLTLHDDVPSFLGAAVLTFPVLSTEVLNLPSCLPSTGLTTITMSGVEVLQNIAP